MASPSIAGVILAGGRSTRMSGGNKALESLADKPLIWHVMERLRPQVHQMAVSVESPSASLDFTGLPQLPDPRPGHNGPLGGLLTALRHFAPQYDWVLLVPCDAPLLPVDLASRLLDGAAGSALPGAVTVYSGEPQPTFSLWNRSLLPEVERAVGGEGLGGFRQLMRTVRVARVVWPPSDPSPFFNVNDAQALEEVRRCLRVATNESRSCSA